MRKREKLTTNYILTWINRVYAAKAMPLRRKRTALAARSRCRCGATANGGRGSHAVLPCGLRFFLARMAIFPHTHCGILSHRRRFFLHTDGVFFHTDKKDFKDVGFADYAYHASSTLVAGRHKARPCTSNHHGCFAGAGLVPARNPNGPTSCDLSMRSHWLRAGTRPAPARRTTTDALQGRVLCPPATRMAQRLVICRCVHIGCGRAQDPPLHVGC